MNTIVHETLTARYKKELLSWKLPYWNKLNDAAVTASIIRGQLPDKPFDLPDTTRAADLWLLCQNCWTDRRERPSAGHIFLVILFAIERDGGEFPGSLADR